MMFMGNINSRPRYDKRSARNSGGGGPGGSSNDAHGGNGNGHHQRMVRFDDGKTPTTGGGVLDSLWGLFTGVTASVCVFGVLVLLGMLYVIIRPFSQTMYRRLACSGASASLLDAWALLLPNVTLKLTADSDVPGPVGVHVLVSNHIVDTDWWALAMLGRCVGWKGSLKAFLRNEFLHVNTEVFGATGHNGGHGNASTSSQESGSSSSNLAPSHPSPTAATTGKLAINGESHHSPSCSNTNTHSNARSPTPHMLSLTANLLHKFLDFPLLNEDDYITDRPQLISLLKSFATQNSAPTHLLYFPEGWCVHRANADRGAILKKANEFAAREGRPQLKHILLPRTRGFNSKLEALRVASPIIYDVTLAYSGYNGSLPPNNQLSFFRLWSLLRNDFPREIHMRIKRHSIEEVLQDSSWLDKKWAEKDRLLSHFARHQTFPVDNRGYRQHHRLFETKHYAVESSLVSLGRLLLLPCTVPFLLLISIPIVWTVTWVWLGHQAYLLTTGIMRGRFGGTPTRVPSTDNTAPTPGSAPDTPFFPATPFASPSNTNWNARGGSGGG